MKLNVFLFIYFYLGGGFYPKFSLHLSIFFLPFFKETKTIKPITNEAFVASSGGIITDYNDLYCLFT